MKKRKKEIFDNVIRGFFWIVGFGLLNWFILHRVENYFGVYAENGKIIRDSYVLYRQFIGMSFASIVCLSAIWWLIACGKFQIREKLENYTVLWGIGFIILSFAVSILLYLNMPGVVRSNGSVIRLLYLFAYPCIFSAAILGLSPNSINEVILPGNIWSKVLSALFFLAVCIWITLEGGI